MESKDFLYALRCFSNENPMILPVARELGSLQRSQIDFNPYSYM